MIYSELPLKVQQIFDLCNIYYSKKFDIFYILDIKLDIRRFLGLLISNLKPNITKFKIVDSRMRK